ncbi:hypothetical protein TorRG33x02_327850 [Trema orientale]|uniref:Uncharacterized protein n=1 Tax=Trema orientale TaxID=63057 RepID=A0A2P5BAJ5_TREOI|nr:hypothetical protein TorRG33x02_327850 [Trema orientale]
MKQVSERHIRFIRENTTLVSPRPISLNLFGHTSEPILLLIPFLSSSLLHSSALFLPTFLAATITIDGQPLPLELEPAKNICAVL